MIRSRCPVDRSVAWSRTVASSPDPRPGSSDDEAFRQARHVRWPRLVVAAGDPSPRGHHHEVVSPRLLCVSAPRLWNRRYRRHWRWFCRRWNERHWRRQRRHWRRQQRDGRWHERNRRWERWLRHLHRGAAVQLHLGLVHAPVSLVGRVSGQLYGLDLHSELQREQQLPAHLWRWRELHAELRVGHLPADGHHRGVDETTLQRRVDVSGHMCRRDELQADRGHRYCELHGLQLSAGPARWAGCSPADSRLAQ